MGSFGLEYLLLSRISKSKWKTGTIGYPTYEELAGGFYSEAATLRPAHPQPVVGKEAKRYKLREAHIPDVGLMHLNL